MPIEPESVLNFLFGAAQNDLVLRGNIDITRSNYTRAEIIVYGLEEESFGHHLLKARYQHGDGAVLRGETAVAPLRKIDHAAARGWW